MCSGSENASDKSYETETKQKIRDEVAGVSEQFIDDFVFILMKIQNRSDIKMSQHERFVSTPGRLQQMQRDNLSFVIRIHFR